ncbi:MAG: hypothetical protein IPI73_17705 [Betaproteobacteria bacterium]|nr:hypothetical protein [Betaproteobacteria bacterium]
MRFAQAVAAEFGIDEEEVARRVVGAYARAAGNPRGIRHAVPSLESVGRSPFEAMLLRSKARSARLTDGAVAMVLASERFVNSHPGCRPLARIAGVGWATDSYRLDAARLRSLTSARVAWREAMRQAGVRSTAELDVVELESQSGFHEAAYVRAFGIENEDALSPSGGPFAQNPPSSAQA